MFPRSSPDGQNGVLRFLFLTGVQGAKSKREMPDNGLPARQTFLITTYVYYNSFMYYVYILTNKNNSTFYIGFTGRLIRRSYEHKEEIMPGFTRRYQIHKLLYYEQYTDVRDALAREKKLKKWRRKWKIDLINKFNPGWRDLRDELGIDLSGQFSPY